VQVDDKNIELGTVASPTDTTADGGGITLKGATDKTILWTNAQDAWVYNQGITVGVNDTGHDVKFFGATSGAYMLWDESVDTLNVVGGSSEEAYLYFQNATTGVTASDGVTIGMNANEDAIILQREAGNIILSTSGTERMRIVSDGKVGIGDTSPSHQLVVDSGTTQATAMQVVGYGGYTTLHLLGDATNTGTAQMLIESTGTGNANIVLNTGGALDWTIGVDASETNDPLNFYDYASASNVMTLVNGQVGIGTLTPASKLHVHGTMQVGVDGTGHDVKFFGATSGAYMLWDESQDDLIIGGAGRVGIGTPSPSHVFEINHSNQGMWGLYVNGTASSSGIGAHIETTTDDSGHALRVSTGAGASRFVVTNEGNVGIGSAVPVVALDVVGAISATTTITATSFSGSGASLTALSGTNISTGTVAAARVATLNQNTTGNANTCTYLATGRTIGMTGDVVWTSGTFNGSGNVTGTATIQTDAVDIAMLSATGTAGATTFLRGDNTWVVPTDTIYTHPSTAGNKHIPSGGSSGKFLKYSSSGTATWADDNNTIYTHPSTAGNKHIPSGGSSGYFLKYSSSGTAVWAADNNTIYTHPSTAGNKHIPSGGSSGQFLKYSSSGTAVWAADNNTIYSHPTHPGDDFGLDTGALTGATVISDIDINVTTDGLGHVTDANGTVATRNLTLANLGYSGATNANYITNNNQLTNGAGYITGYTDTNTTYTAGTGMSLSGTQFNCSITNNNQLTNGAGYITGYTDTNTTYTAGTGMSLSGTQFNWTASTMNGAKIELHNNNTILSNGSRAYTWANGYSVAIGNTNTLRYNRYGSKNTCIGWYAGETVGWSNISGGGERNTFVGYYAGGDVSTGFGGAAGYNNLMLGYNSGMSGSPTGMVTTGSNILCLGDNSISAFYCADTSISSSDGRDKTDIENFTAGLDWIEAMRPVTFRWDKRSWYTEYDEETGEITSESTPDGTHKKDKKNLGFIAQEVLEIEKAHGFASDKNNMLTVNMNEDDTAYGMKYERLVPVLVNAIKELSAKVKTLESA
jgi:hypothetical protein